MKAVALVVVLFAGAASGQSDWQQCREPSVAQDVVERLASDLDQDTRVVVDALYARYAAAHARLREEFANRISGEETINVYHAARLRNTDEFLVSVDAALDEQLRGTWASVIVDIRLQMMLRELDPYNANPLIVDVRELLDEDIAPESDPEDLSEFTDEYLEALGPIAEQFHRRYLPMLNNLYGHRTDANAARKEWRQYVDRVAFANRAFLDRARGLVTERGAERINDLIRFGRHSRLFLPTPVDHAISIIRSASETLIPEAENIYLRYLHERRVARLRLITTLSDFSREMDEADLAEFETEMARALESIYQVEHRAAGDLVAVFDAAKQIIPTEAALFLEAIDVMMR